MRSCGDCRECCISMDVYSMDKPAGTPCKHLCSKGCGIYDERPDDCKMFECSWLMGMIPSSLKPNRCGAVMWGSVMTDEGTGEQKPVLRVTIRPGTKLHPRVRKFVQRTSMRGIIIVSDGVKLWGWARGKCLGSWGMDDRANWEMSGGQVRGLRIEKGKARNERVVATQ